jgi:hypothetical protein
MRDPKPVKPLVVPVAMGASQDGDFHLNANELFLFDVIAQEHINIAGTECDIYQQNKRRTTTDALYDENIVESWDGPYRLRAWVEYPQVTPEVRNEGFRKTFPSTLWVARVDIERVGARAPFFGDVVHFWKMPYFNETSTSYDAGRTPKGYYFTMTEVLDDGHLFDQPSFVGFKCTLARNTEFTPERRLHNI